MEAILLNRFEQFAAQHVSPVERDFFGGHHFLLTSCLARHYGVPTRLVDWTDSLWIGAYFAAQLTSEQDAEGERPGYVRAFDRRHLARALERANAQIELRFTPENPSEEYRLVAASDLWKEAVRVDGSLTPFLLFEPAVSKLPDAAKCMVITFFRMSGKFSRLVNQRGAFTFANTPGICHWTQICATLSGSPNLGKGVREIEIVPRAKREVLRGLEQMGIHGASVFPGLDGIGRSLVEFAWVGDLDVALQDQWRLMKPEPPVSPIGPMDADD